MQLFLDSERGEDDEETETSTLLDTEEDEKPVTQARQLPPLTPQRQGVVMRSRNGKLMVDAFLPGQTSRLQCDPSLLMGISEGDAVRFHVVDVPCRHSWAAYLSR